MTSQQMMAQIESDNLTDALTRWSDAGVKKPDLAAVTLYRDFLTRALTTSSAAGRFIDASTELIQMIQGE